MSYFTSCNATGLKESHRKPACSVTAVDKPPYTFTSKDRKNVLNCKNLIFLKNALNVASNIDLGMLTVRRGEWCVWGLTHRYQPLKGTDWQLVFDKSAVSLCWVFILWYQRHTSCSHIKRNPSDLHETFKSQPLRLTVHKHICASRDVICRENANAGHFSFETYN